jgi:hypothetical protein
MFHSLNLRINCGSILYFKGWHNYIVLILNIFKPQSMKKNLFLLLSVILISIIGSSQENPCPTVSGVRKTNIVNNGNGTCTGTITLHLTNDVSQSNPKGVQVEVLIGASTTPTITQCFLASTVLGGADFTTSSFTALCNAVLTIRITRFTASNGNCQGGTCGNVIIIQESPLPVTFTHFTAIRNRSVVSLKWETSFEQNNSGFAIERNTNGTWQEVAFVASQAPGGNSSDLLSYQYIDVNNTKGISQYRIRQVDFDNRSKYSEVRTVRGEAQIGKIIVYPNPTLDGKVNVSFEDASVIREVSLMDMSGRVLKQWKAITSNNITIENLTPGMYTLRVVVPETGEQTVEKIVVNKR